MRIGFDAKRAAQNATGLGNYSRFIISLLARMAPEVSQTLYVPNPKKAQLLDRLPPSDRLTTVYPTGLLSMSGALWRTYGITRRLEKDGIQIFHGLSNELPLNIRKAQGVKSIVTIHDLLFLRFPEGYKAIDRKIYDYKFRRACHNADRIIAVSQFTKQEIIDRYAISPDKIDVVYQGCDPQFRQVVSDEQKDIIRELHHLPRRYILYVGSIERRKNLLLLAKALKRVDPSVRVIAIGRRTDYTDEVEKYLEENHLKRRMRLIHSIPFRHLPAIYQMASVFVYPSRCEGFGIPMLEAICSGVPAVGCTGSCLEEAGGPESAYVSPDDPDELADTLNAILTDEARQKHMTECGYRYAEGFRDESLLKSLMAVYERTLTTV